MYISLLAALDMSNQRIPYAYEPLSKNPDEIRLLKLMPPSSSGDIEIEIIRVPSSAPPAYEALSYVWGPPERTHEVTVKTSSKKCFPRLSRRRRFLFGRSKFKLSHLAISRNLFIALQHLSLAKKPRLLWIDAICINQDNISERSEQVNKMASIYGNAQLVILWLGEEAHASSSAIETLGALGNGVNIFNIGGSVRKVSSKPDSLARKLEHNAEDMAQMATSWAAIEKLLERPCEQYRSPTTPLKGYFHFLECSSHNQGILSLSKHAFILQY
jgi:hypothetical protein